MTRVLYRVRQFLRAVRGQDIPPDLDEFAALLTAQQHELFRRMTPLDQQHCLAVARALVDRGYRRHDLLQAALLHDVGKSLGPIAVWERVVYVLLSRWMPRLISLIGSARPGGRGHGLYILAHQVEAGAHLAQEAGCSSQVVILIGQRGAPELQAALQAADDTN